MDVKLNRKIFNKDKFNNTINTEFGQLKPVKDSFIFDVNLANIDDFWTLYDKFFYEIPKEGEVNSHEYLVEKSTDYIGKEKVNAEIEALLQEINELRQENLRLRQQQNQLVSGIGNTNLSSSPIEGIIQE